MQAFSAIQLICPLPFFQPQQRYNLKSSYKGLKLIVSCIKTCCESGTSSQCEEKPRQLT